MPDEDLIVTHTLPEPVPRRGGGWRRDWRIGMMPAPPRDAPPPTPPPSRWCTFTFDGDGTDFILSVESDLDPSDDAAYLDTMEAIRFLVSQGCPVSTVQGDATETWALLKS